MACLAEVNTASTPSPSTLPSTGVPPDSLMTDRRDVSSSLALALNAASPSCSVRAVDSAMSAKRRTAMPSGSSGAAVGSSPSPRNSSMAAKICSMLS